VTNLSMYTSRYWTIPQATLGYANAHYPERSKVIFLVNAPWYCSTGWKIVKPLIHPNTQKKVSHTFFIVSVEKIGNECGCLACGSEGEDIERQRDIARPAGAHRHIEYSRVLRRTIGFRRT